MLGKNAKSQSEKVREYQCKTNVEHVLMCIQYLKVVIIQPE